MLLLHGWGSSSEDMKPLAAGLSHAYCTHAVDLPGHGASPPPPEPWGVAEQAQVVAEYVNENIGRSVSIIGHSNGGRLALYMASQDEMSDLIDALALISPSGVEPERTLGYHVRTAIATMLKAPVRVLPAPLRAPARDWLRHTVLWRVLGSSDYNAEEGVMRETFVKTVNHHLNGALGRIQVPTLLFWGSDDEAISRRQITVMEEAIQDCGLVELEGAGHFGHLDQPRRVLSAIRHFLENS